ncbi:hypothetical protein D3C85_1641240 [compost metagenome]
MFQIQGGYLAKLARFNPGFAKSGKLHIGQTHNSGRVDVGNDHSVGASVKFRRAFELNVTDGNIIHTQGELLSGWIRGEGGMRKQRTD